MFFFLIGKKMIIFFKKKLPVFLPAVWLSKQPGQVFDIILTLVE